MPARKDINHAGRVNGIAIGLASASCAIVCLRLWVRLKLTRQGLGLDDAFIIAAVVLLIAAVITLWATTEYGVGRHIEYVDPKDLVPLFKIIFAHGLIYVSLMFTIKQSVLLFYRRLTASQYFRAWCWGFMGLNTVLWFIFSMTGPFGCKPVAFFWDKSIPGGRCVQLGKLYLANAALNVITDVIALLLPVRAVWSLSTSTSTKIQLGFLLMLGFFTCIASFIRMSTLFNFATATDITYSMVKAHIWAMVEVNTGIIVVCAPTVKPAFTRYVWLSFLGKSPNNSSTGQSRSGGQSLPNNPNLPNSFEKTPRKKDFKKEQITTDHFIEHEMAQYGVRGFDEESGHGRSRSRSREANSASTSQRELAAGSDGEAEPQQQQPSGPS